MKYLIILILSVLLAYLNQNHYPIIKKLAFLLLAAVAIVLALIIIFVVLTLIMRRESSRIGFIQDTPLIGRMFLAKLTDQGKINSFGSLVIIFSDSKSEYLYPRLVAFYTQDKRWQTTACMVSVHDLEIYHYDSGKNYSDSKIMRGIKRNLNCLLAQEDFIILSPREIQQELAVERNEYLIPLNKPLLDETNKELLYAFHIQLDNKNNIAITFEYKGGKIWDTYGRQLYYSYKISNNLPEFVQSFRRSMRYGNY